MNFIIKFFVFAAIALGLAYLVDLLAPPALFVVLLVLVYRWYGQMKRYGAGGSKKKTPNPADYVKE